MTLSGGLHRKFRKDYGFTNSVPTDLRNFGKGENLVYQEKIPIYAEGTTIIWAVAAVVMSNFFFLKKKIHCSLQILMCCKMGIMPTNFLICTILVACKGHRSKNVTTIILETLLY